MKTNLNLVAAEIIRRLDDLRADKANAESVVISLIKPIADERDARQVENDSLLGFAGAVLHFHRDNDCSDVDGGTVQDAAVKFGLLAEKTFDEPCGEGCTCAEMSRPPYHCFVLSTIGLAAVNKSKTAIGTHLDETA